MKIQQEMGAIMEEMLTNKGIKWLFYGMQFGKMKTDNELTV